MPRTQYIELGDVRSPIRIPILHEDRSVMAIDKPAGWLLVPFNWQRTQRNLQAAIVSSIAAKDFWARSRNLKFLRNVHRLDGDTSGILLMAKSLGAVNTYGDLFESRKMEKTYLVVVHGIPKKKEWTCHAKLGPDPKEYGRIMVDPKNGKDAETSFRLLATEGNRALIEAYPFTGRTHQIRVHLLESGHPVVGDELYGPDAGSDPKSLPKKRQAFPLGLRAIKLSYFDPFLRKQTHINAPVDEFLEAFGFTGAKSAEEKSDAKPPAIVPDQPLLTRRPRRSQS